ncbi:LEA type 2 family protein [Hymenobacter coccineus]|uniref:LEA type 2 family protein n=1 Tax=Hymenobacter coccineus TaxID=1908235 RepID=UPI000ABCD9AA|nr:LEA type 2 family protein [Hymenobacter coccineus]
MATFLLLRLSSPCLFAALLGAGLCVSSCAGLNQQKEEGQNFKECEFKLQSIEQATLGGVDVTNVRSAADLSGGDRARIVAAYATGSLPLNMRVNLQVTNPNNDVAALNTLEYKVLLDGNEVATGATTQRIEVGPNSTAIATVPVNADVRKAIADGGLESVGNFALGLADRNRQPTRVTIAIRPTVKILGTTVKRPGYITVEKDVTARQLINERTTRPDSLGAPRP